MNFKIEEGNVKFGKDCKLCSHINVCKFHEKMKETCKSTLMYEMNQYSESNNSLAAFEENVNCRYRTYSFINEDNSLNSKTPESVVNVILRDYGKSLVKIFSTDTEECKLRSYSTNFTKREVTYVFVERNDAVLDIDSILKIYKSA